MSNLPFILKKKPKKDNSSVSSDVGTWLTLMVPKTDS